MKWLKTLVITWRVTGLVTFVFILIKLIIIQHWYTAYDLHNLFGISMLSLVVINFVIGNLQEVGYSEFITNRYVKIIFRATIAIFIVGVLFKIQHWKGNDIMLIISMPVLAGYSLAFCANRANQVQEEIKEREKIKP